MIAEATPGTDSSEPRQPDGSAWPIPPVDGYTLDHLYELDLPPHTELIDGSLVFASPQREFHSLAMYLLELGLRSNVPEHLRVRREMAVVLSPRNVPEPDLVVVVVDAEANSNLLTTRYEAKDVVLAVEVVSPESESRDRDTKPHKYAAAGIPHFWRVEMAGESKRPVVYVYELDPVTRAYVSAGVHRDRLKVEQPYPISIDLTGIDHL